MLLYPLSYAICLPLVPTLLCNALTIFEFEMTNPTNQHTIFINLHLNNPTNPTPTNQRNVTVSKHIKHTLKF